MSDRILTDEVRELLLGDMPFSASSTIDFTPKQYLKKDDEGKVILPSEFIAIFKVRGFTSKEKLEAKKGILNLSKNADQMQDLTRLCVEGWENLFDLGTKKELEYKQDDNKGADKDLFRKIPDAIQSDIFLHLCKISGLMDTTKLSLLS